MKKKELANTLNDVLAPAGFKKKGNYWIINGNEITKMVNLQKSQFNNVFYINYGYIINSIPLDNLMMHIFKRLSSKDANENNKIEELLNLANNLSDELRINKLKQVLNNMLIKEVVSVNKELDVLEEIKKLPTLNLVPLVVKKHFDLA